MSQEIIRATGMSCQHCVGRVTKSLKEIAGVQEVGVDLATGTITIGMGDPGASREQLEKAIRDAGYQVVG